MFDKYLSYRPYVVLYEEDGAYGWYLLTTYKDGCLLYADKVCKGEFSSVEEAKKKNQADKDVENYTPNNRTPRSSCCSLGTLCPHRHYFKMDFLKQQEEKLKCRKFTHSKKTTSP